MVSFIIFFFLFDQNIWNAVLTYIQLIEDIFKLISQVQMNLRHLQIFEGIFKWIQDIFYWIEETVKSFEDIFKYNISIIHLKISWISTISIYIQFI